MTYPPTNTATFARLTNEDGAGHVLSATPAAARPLVGVSSCLLGHAVRYDGGHKHSPYITDVLARHFELAPWCPEVAIGLGIPRPPIRLSGDPAAPRVVGVDDPSVDVTERLRACAREVAGANGDLAGYILKRASPSCGMERVTVYGAKGVPRGTASGAFAGELMRALPLLPCEEEGRLSDPALRESFVSRVFVLHRWQRLLARGLTPGALVEFHTRHKFQLLAHDERAYRALGRLVARAGCCDLEALAGEYISLAMRALTHRATRRRHSNVLQHVMGFLKNHLDSGDKAELLRLIDAYRNGRVALVAPLKIIRHHLHRHPSAYMDYQYYLDAHADDLMPGNTS